VWRERMYRVTKKRNENRHRRIFSKCKETKRRYFETITGPEGVLLLLKKELASQNTANCTGCDDVYEEPITENWIKCGQCWTGGTRPLRVVKELVIMSVILLVYARLPGPVRTLIRQGVRQYALHTSSFKWLSNIGKIFLRLIAYLNVFQNK
jgi:hypothetical protein